MTQGRITEEVALPTTYEEFAALATERWLRERWPAWFAQMIPRASEAYGRPPLEIQRDVAARVGREYFKLTRLGKRYAGRLVTYLHGNSYYLWKYWVDKARYRPAEAVPLVPDAGQLTTPLRASIVLLSYNRVDYLRTTIPSLFATTKRGNFELLVVDNGSSDGSVPYLRDLADRGFIDKLILRSKNHGTSPGFNCGFAYADPTTDFLVKLDSDIKIITPGWFEQFVTVFERNPRVGVLALNQTNTIELHSARREQLGPYRVISSSEYPIGGACMTIPRPVFNEIGYFNENFDQPYMPDDVDYYCRATWSGYGVYFLADFISYHRHDLDKKLGRRSRAVFKKMEAAGNTARVEYHRGLRPLKLSYARYDGCAFPPDSRVIEIE